MFTEITVEAKYIAALKLVAPKKPDVRYYLNGICVEVSADEFRLVASNGHRLGVFRGRLGAEAPLTGEFILPIEMFSHVKAKGVCTLRIAAEELSVAYSEGDTVSRGKRIDARYPRYRRLFPERVTGVSAQFDASYLGDLAKIGKVLGTGIYPAIGHNGHDPAVVDFGGPNFVVLLMPCRGAGPLGSPSWVYEEAQ